MAMPFCRLKLLLIAVTLIFPEVSGASVVIPCGHGQTPLARLIAANEHVFIARVTSITWIDPQENIVEPHEYPKGTVYANFKSLGAVKGDPSKVPNLVVTLFGNPDSLPYLQVARTYLVFTNDGSISRGGCWRLAYPLGIAYSNDYGKLTTRLRSPNPDSGFQFMQMP